LIIGVAITALPSTVSIGALVSPFAIPVVTIAPAVIVPVTVTVVISVVISVFIPLGFVLTIFMIFVVVIIIATLRQRQSAEQHRNRNRECRCSYSSIHEIPPTGASEVLRPEVGSLALKPTLAATSPSISVMLDARSCPVTERGFNFYNSLHLASPSSVPQLFSLSENAL
jgi:O-antigen ligase